MRTGLRLGVALVCLGGAAWTCNAILRPARVASMTYEQCLELVRQGPGGPVVALELGAHIQLGLAALRKCGPDGALILQQLAKELAK